MAPNVTVYTSAPSEVLIERLASHLPLTLPLIRRLRFTRFPGGMTENTRILWASGESVEKRKRGEKEEERDLGTGRETTPFAAAYLDFSRGPETELWIYSSLEHRLYTKTDTNTGTGEGEDKGKAGGPNEQEKDLEREEIACAVCLLGEVKRQQDLYFVPGSPEAKTRVFPTVLVGNLNEVLRERLASPSPSGGGMKIASTGLYDILFFRVDDLPDIGLPEVLLANGEGEEEGRRWSWDDIRREDIAFTISRTHIHREERTMKLLPSTALYLDDGTPIAWAFLGPDSSLSSLHCEEPYRGKGIAKAVAVKILRDHLKDYGNEGHGWGWADVAPDNTQSQGVCRSLRGQKKWQISWSHLDLDKSFPDQ